MFIQHKSLTSLNLPAEKITHLHAASSNVQLAFAGFPPQLCSAYLVLASSGQKSLVLIAFYLVESGSSIFFVPQHGEVTADKAQQLYEEGIFFVESMGFTLTETDFHLKSMEKKQEYWKSLPICKPSRTKAAVGGKTVPQNSVDGDNDRALLQSQSLASLGRFLSAM